MPMWIWLTLAAAALLALLIMITDAALLGVYRVSQATHQAADLQQNARAAAARLYPGRRIVCGLLFTDGPRLLRLSDAILDRQMGELARRLDPDEAHS